MNPLRRYPSSVYALLAYLGVSGWHGSISFLGAAIGIAVFADWSVGHPTKGRA